MEVEALASTKRRARRDNRPTEMTPERRFADMDSKTWLSMLERWLHPVAPEGVRTSIGVREVPPDTRLLGPKHGAASADQPGNILVAMVQQGEGSQQAERVHRGHYLVPDPDICILVGDEGVFFTPWELVAWVRT
jgi:hypothetical protein